MKVVYETTCVYNHGVDCNIDDEAHNCEKCGWNPNAPKRPVRYLTKREQELILASYSPSS